MNSKKLSAQQITKKIDKFLLSTFYIFFLMPQTVVPQGWVEVIVFFCPLQPLSKGITFHGSTVSCFMMSALFCRLHTVLD